MREIKFRGKRIDNGEWVYGFYAKQGKNHHIVKESFGGWVVDPDTVGEYTGLKDRNGVEIYEGDIVSHRTIGGMDKGPWTGEVTIHPTQGVKVGAMPICFDFEVIGNIYESKEE